MESAFLKEHGKKEQKGVDAIPKGGKKSMFEFYLGFLADPFFPFFAGMIFTSN